MSEGSENTWVAGSRPTAWVGRPVPPKVETDILFLQGSVATSAVAAVLNEFVLGEAVLG